jgi:prepilin signal peptidase PulO-like enzyme (type II secretory pathway)
MVNLLVFLIISYGFSNIVVTSEIMSKFRKVFSYIPIFGGAVNCMMCFGFWVGVILSFIVVSPVQNILLSENGELFNKIINPVLTGFISSGFSWIVYVLDNFLFSKSSQEEQEENDGQVIL